MVETYYKQDIEHYGYFFDDFFLVIIGVLNIRCKRLILYKFLS
jgi:hypothetical protein